MVGRDLASKMQKTLTNLKGTTIEGETMSKVPDWSANIIQESENLSLLAYSAGLPRDTVKTVQLNWQGETVDFPLKMQSSQTWTCVLTEAPDGVVIKDVEEYLLIPKPRIVAIAIIPLDDKFKPVFTTGTTLYFAFLQSMTPTELRADSIQPMEWTLTFKYAYSRRFTI
jgi:hypothetical protein